MTEETEVTWLWRVKSELDVALCLEAAALCPGWLCSSPNATPAPSQVPLVPRGVMIQGRPPKGSEGISDTRGEAEGETISGIMVGKSWWG